MRILVLVLAILPGTLSAQTWSADLRFPPELIQTEEFNYDNVSWSMVTARPDARLERQRVAVGYQAEPGKPRLPFWSVTLVIPQGMRVAGVEVVPGPEVTIPLSRPVFPAQPPVPFSQSALPKMTMPEADAYSAAVWPQARYSVSPVGVKSGFRLVTVDLYPLRLESGALMLATSVGVRVRYEPDPAAEPARLTSRQLELFGADVRALVANPDDVSRYAPEVRAADFGEFDCVIVTSDALVNDFQPLVNWHNRKGWYTVVRTVSWINSNYSGRDTQEKIRNFVRDYFTNRGMTWLLLGGDNGVVPARQARAIVGSYTGDIPCDLYYADLQWSWDGNNNNIFGEASVDTVDLYYDLYVGRASVDNSTQVQTFVNKVITHETNPPTDYLRRILLVDALLWSGYDHQQSNDSIANITPAGWTDRFFHDPPGTTAVRDSLNNGFQFCHMVGHGNDVGIYNGSTAFYGNGVISGHNNGSRVGLINSIACYPGNFEYSDCLAENSHNCATGGALAVIMNSRYGWGTPPVIGPSEKLDIRFYDYFFNRDTMPIGVTHAASKEVHRSLAINQQVWRWCYYELNLFADPLLMMYENVPAALTQQFTTPIPTGSQNYTVRVLSGGTPVVRALVCLSKGSEVYTRGFTDASGYVTLSINPTTAGWMYINATAANYLPRLDSAQVIVANLDAGCYRIIAPSGTVDSGTSVQPRAMVRNYSLVTLTNLPVRFNIGSVYSQTVTVPSLAAGDSVQVTFPNWSARPGNFALRCSTRLTGDVNSNNDHSDGALFVRYRDVGTVSITVPSPVDSGASVPIVATLRNYGNVNESFNVRLTISGTGYDQTRSKVLNAGQQDTAVFPNWTALQRGTRTVACSTQLAGDMQGSNNRATASVVVNVRDVRAAAILSPVGMVDSTGTVAVQARVRNTGTTTESFSVLFRIAGPASYSDMKNVNNLAAGDSVLVDFANWTCGARGSYTTACSTRLATDQNPNNDRLTGSFSVRVRDAAAVAVVAPAASVDSGTMSPVRAAVANLSSENFTVRVFMRIGTFYFDSVDAFITAGRTDTVSLPNWVARAPRGVYTVKCSVYVAGDQTSSNNTVQSQTSIQVHDVGTVAILAPTGQVDSGAVRTPSARVRNYGTAVESFSVRFSITDGYSQTVALSLNPGAESLVTFPAWSANTVGAFTTRCSTLLGGDAYPANNRQSGTVAVSGSDVGIAALVAPGLQADPGPVIPIVRVANYSPSGQSFWSWFAITTESGTPVYRDSAFVSALGPDSMRNVSFGVWNAVAGRYSIRCSVGLGDHNPGNDTLRSSCLVVTHDVGVVAVVSPSGTMRPITITPIVRIRSWSDGVENFPVYVAIIDSITGDTAYVGSSLVTGLQPGQTKEQRFDAWNSRIGFFRVVAWSGLGQDVNPVNDTMVAETKVTPGEIGWQRRADLPLGTAPVKAGGALTALEGRIFALKGNKTNEFYQYDIATNAWSALPSVPLGASGRQVGKSGCLTTDGSRYIYVLKGNKSTEFWRFDVQYQSWSDMAALPTGSGAPKGGTGIAFVRQGDSSWIYCLKGSTTWEFYRYSVEANTWTARAQAPSGPSGKKFKSGSALCAAGSDHLLALKSATTEFYAYDIASDAWTARAGLPAMSRTGKKIKAKDGAALSAVNPNTIYAFSGGNRDFFFLYNDSLNSWAELAPLPLGSSGKKPKSGAALAGLGKQVWALKGNKTLEFWVYTPDTMLLFAPPVPARSGVMAEAQSLGRGSMTLVPNPLRGGRGALEFTLPAPGPVLVCITDVGGRTVLRQSFAAGRSGVVPLDLSRLASGVYLVKVESGSTRMSAKLVLQ
uniref:T9SS type A sorting domain-containing protein n=1 Tax=candidate division WOR-3 bacterium TaxID=2052148 RepID=A0A7C4GG43_UNCW3